MQSKVAEIIRQIHAMGDDINMSNVEELVPFFDQLKIETAPFYDDAFDYADLMRYAATFARIAAINMISYHNQEGKPATLETIMMASELGHLISAPYALPLIAFAMKFAIITYRAEERARLASEGLQRWVLPSSPESTPPNSDPPAQPHDEPPSTS